MHRETNNNDLQEIITQAIAQMKKEQGSSFHRVNLAELSRRTGLSRAVLRGLEKNDFQVRPHGNTGRKADVTVLTGFTGIIDNLLRQNVTNAVVCFERIKAQGYTGGQTTVREYIENHQDLIPPKRMIVDPQGNRGRRYETEPGEAYQMDWGFVNVETSSGSIYQVACFAMICHHCGQRFVEFFPNAKQENLFIGMIHAFYYLGIPKNVLTDNMKSVVVRRDLEGKPIWQHDYESFMKLVGFNTKLCKPRHPFTKGKVERLVRFVKQNFIAGRLISNITELNIEALQWCRKENGRYHRAVDCTPDEMHQRCCWLVAGVLTESKELGYYLCPERRISFDGFVSFEGRRFGVPYWYTKKTCRIQRKDFEITVFSDDLTKVLTSYDVTWSRRDQFCRDQYVKEQPQEFPTMAVKSKIYELDPPIEADSRFSRFDFGEVHQ